MHKSINNLIEINKEINLNNLNLESKVKIIAVSKTFSMINILPLIEYGHKDFGENKVQEALEKWLEIKNSKTSLNLHMIGRLQTNKVKQAVKIFDYIHSLDNIKLAEKIANEQKKINKDIKLLIQVNVGNEKQKNGIDTLNVKNFLEVCKNDLKLNVIGIMCIPPNDKKTNEYFSKMLKLKDELNLSDLSMGMSNDYLNAVNHGSTMIRVGSKIFGERN